jgi:anthranilate synthase
VLCPSLHALTPFVHHVISPPHRIATYSLSAAGATVVVCRSGKSLDQFVKDVVDPGTFHPDICVLSPGPGSPSDFFLSDTIDAMIKRKVPIFGVCLGLQGLFEYFGGELGILDYPMHGKPSIISRSFPDHVEAGHGAYTGAPSFDVLKGLPDQFQVARYHSLHGTMATLPESLTVTASVDNVIMAIQHKSYPIAAVQFHPESLLTLPKNGMKILENALEILSSKHYAP